MSSVTQTTDTGEKIEESIVEAVAWVLTSIETGDTNGEDREQVQTLAGRS